MKSILFLLLAFSASPAFSQITVSSRSMRVIEAPAGSLILGSMDSPQYLVLPDNASANIKWSVQLDYDGVQSADPQVEAFQYATRKPVQVTKIDTYEYLVFGKGEIEAVLSDWDARKIHRFTFEVPESDKPDPEPDPEPDDPDPPPDIIVPNEWGIGMVAYKNAVKNDPIVNEAYQLIYRRAANFLVGQPTPKAIIPDGEPDARNPNRSVLEWMKQEGDKVVCTDEAKCKAWADWKTAVAKAFTESQQSRSYTRDDWYQAFQETADALELAK